MSMPQDAIPRKSIVLQPYYRGGNESPRAAEFFLPPGARNLAWRVCDSDPEICHQLVKNLPPEAAKNANIREHFTKKLFRQLQARKREIAAGSRPHTVAGINIDAALKRYFNAHDLNAKALKIYRAAADEFLAWCERNGVHTAGRLNNARLFEYRVGSHVIAWPPCSFVSRPR